MSVRHACGPKVPLLPLCLMVLGLKTAMSMSMLCMLHTFHAACVDADVERQYIVISASWTRKTPVPWDASCEQLVTHDAPCEARGSFKRVVLTSLAMASLDGAVPRAHEEDHKEDSDFR
jgi:hypothetical protein